MKRGEWVVCIDNEGTCGQDVILTINKVYKIINTVDDHLLLDDNYNSGLLFNKNRFILLTELRRKKLNRILNENR